MNTCGLNSEAENLEAIETPMTFVDRTNEVGHYGIGHQNVYQAKECFSIDANIGGLNFEAGNLEAIETPMTTFGEARVEI